MTPLRAGGPAQVFMAVDHQAGREVELTLFDPACAGADAWAGFARVIIAATAAKIPGLVLPRGVTRTAPTPPSCLADPQMARGLDRRAEQGPTPWRRALQLCERVAEIVERAHAATGAAHRALTSARCVVTAREEVKVLDFGIAELAPGHADDSPYRAPEQQQAAGGPPSDVYAIGVMLHELLTGQRAPAGPLPPWSPPADAPPELAELLTRATAIAPEHRHPDPAALRTAMRAVLDADAKAAAARAVAEAEAAEARAVAEAKAAEARAAEAKAAEERAAAAPVREATVELPLPGGSNLSAKPSDLPRLAGGADLSARPADPPLLASGADLPARPSAAPAEPLLGGTNLSARTPPAPPPPPPLRDVSLSERTVELPLPPDSSPARADLSSGTSAAPPEPRPSQSSASLASSSGSRLAGDPSASASSSSLSGSRSRGSTSPSRAHPTIAPDDSSSSSLSGSRSRGSTSPSRAHPTIAPDDSSSSRSRASIAPDDASSASQSLRASRSHSTIAPSDSASASQSQRASRSHSTLAPADASSSQSLRVSRSHPTIAPGDSSSSLGRASVPGSASPSRSHPTLSSASSSSLQRPRGSASPSRSHPTLAAESSASSLQRPRGSASPSRSHPTLSAESSASTRPRPPGAPPTRAYPTLASAQAQAAASSSSLSRPRPPGAPPSRSYPTLAPSASPPPVPADRTEVLAHSAIVAAERARTGAHPPVPAADKTEVTPRRSVRGLPDGSRGAAASGAAWRRDAVAQSSVLAPGDSTVIAPAPDAASTEEMPVPAFARAPRGHVDPPTTSLPVPPFSTQGRHVDPPTDQIAVPAFADATQMLHADDLLLPPAPVSDPDATRIWRRPPDPSEVEPAARAPESTMMLPTTGETVVHRPEPVPRARSLLAEFASWSLRKKLLAVNVAFALLILIGALAAVAC
ncbi:hypothetical protein [Nannocystis bainbridge]|uniref:Protein kinase domain-containing protein n=1 Tax=Nannocystis bainbridge TaxID=2995303 RepID=A0ABT5DS62_9BACT|nr:hypothetical protein [Nannocystis bainbridge]MDC0716453.1 hypothetical protein [Nannocystis bainbridge]